MKTNKIVCIGDSLTFGFEIEEPKKWTTLLNKELNVATSHGSAVVELQERLFEPDFARSVEITEPFPERWSDHLIEVLGDYIF